MQHNTHYVAQFNREKRIQSTIIYSCYLIGKTGKGNYLNKGESKMLNLGRIVFKITGVMSNRGLVKNSCKIGQRIAETMQYSGGEIKPANVKRIVQDTIGKKVAEKIEFVDRDTFVSRSLDMGGASKSELEQMLSSAEAVTSTNNYCRGASVFIKDFTNNCETAGIIAHELEHALNDSIGKTSVLRGFLGKFSYGRKYIDKVIAKQEELGLQSKYQDLYSEMLSNLETGKRFDIDTVRNLLYSKGILQLGKDKENRLILKVLRNAYKDEVRAYTVQAETNRALGQKYLGKLYDIVANEFNILIKGIAQESKNVRANRIRTFLGMKPKIHVQSAVQNVVPAQFVKATETTEATKNIFKT